MYDPEFELEGTKKVEPESVHHTIRYFATGDLVYFGGKMCMVTTGLNPDCMKQTGAPVDYEIVLLPVNTTVDLGAGCGCHAKVQSNDVRLGSNEIGAYKKW